MTTPGMIKVTEINALLREMVEICGAYILQLERHIDIGVKKIAPLPGDLKMRIMAERHLAEKGRELEKVRVAQKKAQDMLKYNFRLVFKFTGSPPKEMKKAATIEKGEK